MDLERLSEILTEVFFKVEEMARELRLQVNSNNDIMEVMEKANQTLIKINGSLEENLGKIVELASTQDRKAEPSLQAIPAEQKKDLETAMDAVAHEIRNPLMVIGGFAQRLIKKGHDQVDVVKYAELIAQESRRLEQVLNDLMRYSTPYHPSFHSQNLIPVLDKAIESLHDLTSQKQITIKKNFPRPPLSIPLEREGFGNSFRLLLETVIDLAEKGDKKIILTVENIPTPHQIKIELLFSGDPIPEEISQIFHGQDFFDRTFGKGLGLSLCRKIIEAHNGRFELERENEKNRIAIVLPFSSHV